MARAMTRFSSVLAILVIAACSKGGDGKPKAVKLDQLGLSLDVPGDVRVDKAIMGDGQMVQGSSVGAMQVEIPKEAQTLAQAKEDAQMYTPKNLKEETLADGWALTYENKGSMGANFFVDVRRTIDGKNYKCWVTTGESSQAANVLTACKSLRK
jgi:hypothetical protein